MKDIFISISCLVIAIGISLLSVSCEVEKEIVINCPEPLIDDESNEYKTVAIGEQCWMAENLKATKYNDGSSIPFVTDEIIWSHLLTPGYCWYNNNEASFKIPYGALYNWHTVNTGKLCPTGWHVPTDAEWTSLTDYLGGEKVAGGKLKAIGTIEGGDGLWFSPNYGATNKSGFSGIPGGYIFFGFGHMGECGVWWSSTKSDTTNAWCRGLYYASTLVPTGPDSLFTGYSVRCIKDD